MKQAKTFVLLGGFLISVIGMIGCSSGGSSSSSSTPDPAYNPLVGTWKPDAGGPSMVFNADGSGYLTDEVHSISG
jgi:hypothetical protein